MSSYRDGIEYIGNVGRNRARGILPTAAGWDIDPTNLKNITNGNPLIGTGIGSKTLAGAGIVGTIEIDLGRSAFIIAMIRAAVWIEAGLTYGFLNLYDDLRGVFQPSTFSMEIIPAAEHIKGWLPIVGYTSKIQMKLYSTAATTVECKIYEIIALEILP